MRYIKLKIDEMTKARYFSIQDDQFDDFVIFATELLENEGARTLSLASMELCFRVFNNDQRFLAYELLEVSKDETVGHPVVDWTERGLSKGGFNETKELPDYGIEEN
nr:MAG TPA: hypothetical protein [Caudoviricetes sp.]